jgi:hypothetical protein
MDAAIDFPRQSEGDLRLGFGSRRCIAFRAVYLLVALLALTSTFRLTARSQRINKTISGSDTLFSVFVPGLADGFNTRRYADESLFRYNTEPGDYANMWRGRAGVENNISLRLENRGSRIISNPQIEINGKRFLFTFRDMVGEIPLDRSSSLDDTIRTVWNYFCNNTFHWTISSAAEAWFVEPLKAFNTFGAGLCGDNAVLSISTLYWLGYHNVYRLGLGTFHTVGSVQVSSRKFIFDSNVKVLYSNRGSSQLADYAQLGSDQDLIRRQHHFGMRNLETDESLDFGGMLSRRIPTYEVDAKTIDSLSLIIRPNESIEYTWETHPERYQFFHIAYAIFPPPLSNSLGYQEYRPALTPSFVALAQEAVNVEPRLRPGGWSLVSTDSTVPSRLIIDNPNPYALVDGRVIFGYTVSDSTAVLTVGFSKAGDSYQNLVVIHGREPGNYVDTLELYDLIEPIGTPITNNFHLQWEWRSEHPYGFSLDTIQVLSSFQFNPNAIPRLRIGENTIRVFATDGSPLDGLHYMHEYRIIDSIHALPPITIPDYPVNGASVDASQYEFRWELPAGVAMEEISDFHIVVSERADFAFPVSSVFNKLTSQSPEGVRPAWRIPTAGLLLPGKEYYWRVCTRSTTGVYSEWSPTWSFRVTVPGMIRNPRLLDLPDSTVIAWDADSIGTRPAKYLVLANDMMGFSYADSLIIDSTVQSSYAIRNAQRFLPYPYYRIIAVDNDGGRSEMSDLIGTGAVRMFARPPEYATVGDTIRVEIARIQPRDGYSTTYYDPLTVVTDSLLLTPVDPGSGMQIGASTILAPVRNGADSVLQVAGRTTDTQQDFLYRIPLRLNLRPDFGELHGFTAAEDSAVVARISAIDPDGDPVHYAIAGGPHWLSIDSTTGSLVGTPGANDVGTAPLSLRIRDNKGGVALASTMIEVTHTNHPPDLLTAGLQGAREDSLYHEFVSATDRDSSRYGDHLSYHLRVSPEWLFMDSTTGLLSGTPRGRNVGMDSIVVQVSDQFGGSTRRTFTLIIVHTNHPPVVTALPDSMVTEDSLYMHRILAADPDSTLFGDTLRFEALALPSWMTLDSVSGIVRGTASGVNARDSVVRFRVHDNAGGFTDTAVTLHLIHVNHNPVITATPERSAIEDSLYISRFEATDQDSLYFGDVIHYQIVTGPSWCSIDSVSGVLRGVPRGIDVGDAILTLRATDGKGGSVSAEYSIAVSHTNHTPVFALLPDTLVVEDRPYEQFIRATDQDSSLFGDRVRYAFVQRPRWMALDTVNGRLSGRPDAQGVFDTLLAVRATDDSGAAVEFRARLQFAHVNHPPLLMTMPAIHAREDSTLSVALTAHDPDSALFGDRVRFHLSGAPAWLRIDSLTGSLSGVPRGIDVGDTAFSVFVLDDSGAQVSGVVSSRVLHTNHHPQFRSPLAVEAVEDCPFVYRPYAADPDSALFGDRVRYELISAPSWILFDSLRQGVYGIPREGERDATVILLATDGALADTAALRIAVLAVNDPPVLRSPASVRMQEDVPHAVSVSELVRSVHDPDTPDSLLTWRIKGGTHIQAELERKTFYFRTDENWFGTERLTLVVSDEMGLADSAAWVFDVEPVNDAPVVAGMPDVSFPEDSSCTINLDGYVRDVDNATEDLRWSATVISDSIPPVGKWSTLRGGAILPAETFAKQHSAGTDGSRIPHTPDNGWMKSTSHAGTRSTTLFRIGEGDSPAESLMVIIDQSTRTATISSTQDFYGSRIPILFTATDSAGLSGSDTIAVTVLPVDDPPVVTGMPDLVFSADSTVVLSLDRFVHDPDDSIDALTWTMRLSGDGVAASRVQGGISGQAVSARVIAAGQSNKTTTAKTVAAAGMTNVSGSGGITSDAPGALLDSLTVEIDSTTRVATFRAQTHFGVQQLPCIFTAQDPSGLTGSDTVLITVTPSNLPPQISSLPALHFQEDDSLTVGVVMWYAYVRDPDDSISVLAWDVRSGSHTVVSKTQHGYRMRSELNWHGADTLSLIVRDPWGASDTASLRVTVASVPDPPVIISVPDSVYDSNIPFLYQVLVADPDPEDPIRLFSIIGPHWIAIDTSGLVTGHPDTSGTFRIKVIVQDGYMLADTQSFSLKVSGSTGIANDFPEIPTEYSLSQNYPNPYNPSTTIRFGLPSASPVLLRLYDIAGREVATLLEGYRNAGYHSVIVNNPSLASGLYFYRIEAGKFTAVRKMILLK